MLVSLTNLSLFFGMLVILIGIFAVVILWVKKRKAAKAAKEADAPPAAPAGAAPAGQQAIPALFREAATRLKLAPRMQGAKLSSLPLILIVGPEKSGKTSVVMRSGLDPELLAGQVYQDTEIIPTASVNIWLARQTLLVELAAPLARDPAALGVILKHLMPGRIALAFRRRRPARSILLCLNQGPLAGAGTTEEVAAAARPWNQSLTSIANSLGSQVPVYVLFTNLDSVSGFSNFVANLAAREPEQAVGATIRPFNPAGRGAYAEETARVVNSHFTQVVYSLCDTRVPLLLREQDRVEAALQYQFPRDFQRLQKNLAQFLVELAKPSQLSVSPFLRGFYFSGIRKVVVEQPAGLSQASLREPMASEPMVATTVFDPEKMRNPAPAAPQRPAPRTNSEWLFVRSLFDGVLFRDRSAQGVSAASSRADKARAVIFGLVALLGLMFLVALSISYVQNRALERQLIEGATYLREPKSGSLEERLEKMRPGVDHLIEYRAHTPPSMRWGLYSGDPMLPAAQEIYCSPLRAGILPATLSRLAGHLKALGTTAGDPDADFALLKTYMMVTTNPDKADPEMDYVLFNMWKETPGAATNAYGLQYLQAEFRTYLGLLPIPDRQTACVNLPAAGIIESAQQHFRDMHYDDHYQSLLQQAGADMKAVNFDQMFPNPAVTDPYVVKGWFTKGGWERMQRILSRPLEEWKSSDWVLGETKPVTQEDVSGYRVRYVTEYKNAWLSYLSGARVTPYKSIPDAAKELDLMSGEQSPLLSLLGIASDHTAVDDDMKSVFQPARAVAPSAADFQPATDYRKKLAFLKNRLDSFQPTGPERDRAVQAVQDAADIVTALTLSFKGEASEPVKKILKAPLTSIEPLLTKQDDDAVNAAGHDLCTSYNALTASRPFNPSSRHEASLDEVDSFFRPEQGLMWTFYNSHLTGTLNCNSSGGCGPTSSPRFPLTRGYDEFFSRLSRISHLLYSGGEPVVRLQLTVQQFNSVQKIDFVVDDAITPIKAGSSGEISWNLRSARSFKVVGDFVGVDSREILFGEKVGRWALFDWLYVDSLLASRGSGVFHWVLTSGADPLSFANGRKKEYEIEVRSGDRDLDLKSLQAGPCKLPVAR